jgi:hypothetical protein
VTRSPESRRRLRAVRTALRCDEACAAPRNSRSLGKRRKTSFILAVTCFLALATGVVCEVLLGVVPYDGYFGDLFIGAYVFTYVICLAKRPSAC